MIPWHTKELEVSSAKSSNKCSPDVLCGTIFSHIVVDLGTGGKR